MVLLAAGFLWWRIQEYQSVYGVSLHSPQVANRLKKLWEYVENNIRDKRYNAAEKALLSILKLDHKNTVAFNRLGILYARQKNFADAIECFEIASSITPTVASLYNLGLVYYEHGDYSQAANSFEKVVDLEPTAPRYIAFAKALNKLNQPKKMMTALEKAVELQKNIRHLELLAQVYERNSISEKAEKTRAEIARMRAKTNRRRRPRKL